MAKGGGDDIRRLVYETDSDSEDVVDDEKSEEEWTLHDRIDRLSRRHVIGLSGGALLGAVGLYRFAADNGYNPDGVDDGGHTREFSLGANEWTSFTVDRGRAFSMLVGIEIPDGSATVFVMPHSEYERDYPNDVDAHSMTVQEGSTHREKTIPVIDSGDWTIVIDNTGRGDPSGMDAGSSVSGYIEYWFQ